jgi:hypothetical protein
MPPSRLSGGNTSLSLSGIWLRGPDSTETCKSAGLDGIRTEICALDKRLPVRYLRTRRIDCGIPPLLNTFSRFSRKRRHPLGSTCHLAFYVAAVIAKATSLMRVLGLWIDRRDNSCCRGTG